MAGQLIRKKVWTMRLQIWKSKLDADYKQQNKHDPSGRVCFMIEFCMTKTPDYNYSTEKEVFFYTPRYYPLDNFSAFSVTIWGKTFPTAEHAYQWKKFSDSEPAIAELICNATNPHQVKKISDAHKAKCPSSWTTDNLIQMELILRAKIEQHQKMRDLLLETGEKELLENSPVDAYWGVGPTGDGLNHLGKLWMKLRDELQ